MPAESIPAGKSSTGSVISASRPRADAANPAATDPARTAPAISTALPTDLSTALSAHLVIC